MFPCYIDGYEDYNDTESNRIRTAREEYRRLGLGIFESFEEYCDDRLERDEH